MKIPPKDYVNAIEVPQSLELCVIGRVHSPYKERHGTPRQSALKAAPENYEPVLATIELFTDVVPSIALKDLDGFDRIWIISWLHLNHHWNPTVRPPRGPKVKEETWQHEHHIGRTRLAVCNCLVVIPSSPLRARPPGSDIDYRPKTYVPYCDAFPNAAAGYVDEAESLGSHERDVFGRSDRK